MEKKLTKRQLKHFAQMTAAERKAAAADAERQMAYIAFSATPSGDLKRSELQARIDHLRELNRTAPK